MFGGIQRTAPAPLPGRIHLDRVFSVQKVKHPPSAPFARLRDQDEMARLSCSRLYSGHDRRFMKNREFIACVVGTPGKPRTDPHRCATRCQNPGQPPRLRTILLSVVASSQARSKSYTPPSRGGGGFCGAAFRLTTQYSSCTFALLNLQVMYIPTTSTSVMPGGGFILPALVLWVVALATAAVAMRQDSAAFTGSPWRPAIRRGNQQRACHRSSSTSAARASMSLLRTFEANELQLQRFIGELGFVEITDW